MQNPLARTKPWALFHSVRCLDLSPRLRLATQETRKREGRGTALCFYIYYITNAHILLCVVFLALFLSLGHTVSDLH